MFELIRGVYVAAGARDGGVHCCSGCGAAAAAAGGCCSTVTAFTVGGGGFFRRVGVVPVDLELGDAGVGGQDVAAELVELCVLGGILLRKKESKNGRIFVNKI